MTAPGLRALVIGAGYMGRRHLDAYASHPSATPVGAVARTQATADRVAADYGVPAFTDVAAALDATAPHIVSVCSPTEHHAAHAEAALVAGAHVLVEKPMTHELDAGRRLLALARVRGRVVMPAHTTLFEPPTLAIVRLVRGGGLGRRLDTIRFERRGRDVSPGEVEKGRDAGGSGGPSGEAEDRGWLYDHLVHVAYVLNRLAGSTPQEVAVASRVARRFGEALRARVTYRNRTEATVDLTSDPADPFRKHLAVEGPGGAAEWTMEAGRTTLRLRPLGEDWRPLAVSGPDAFRAVVHHFVDCIRDDREPLENGDDGLRAMALAAALAGGWPAS